MAEGISYICEVNETRNQLLAREKRYTIYAIFDTVPFMQIQQTKVWNTITIR